jgi:UDP-N-acetylglucosamine 2-epimerase (non-hydrolysing)
MATLTQSRGRTAKIFRVGNVMIDTPHAHADGRGADVARLRTGDRSRSSLHRPANVDLALLGETMAVLPIGKIPDLPMHPRTRDRVGERTPPATLHLIDPVGYLEFLGLQKHARLVITDSGGVQEETTYLGVPCLTVRQNTERPVTITEGTNELVGTNPKKLLRAAFDHLSKARTAAKIPDLWDGYAAERIADVFAKTGAGERR